MASSPDARRSASLFAAVCLVAAGLAAAAGARAAVTPVSQMREVTSFASISAANGGQGSSDTQQITSPDPGSFVETVAAHADLQGTVADGWATQSSTIAPGLVQADGSFWARAELMGDSPFAEGLGMTKLTHRFLVDGPTSYTLAGTLVAAGNGQAFVSLVKQSSGAVVYLTVSDGEQPVFSQGVLETGLYDFSVWTFGSSARRSRRTRSAPRPAATRWR